VERILIERPMTSSQAMREAERCLQCFDPPCARRCPAGIVIPRFIRMIMSGNARGAAEAVRSANAMASSCGLACPDEQLCASVCVRRSIDRPVEIRRLHRFATDTEEAMGPRSVRRAVRGRGSVAIVGAGPGGLACAAELRRLGIEVTLYEARGEIGGVLAGAIPLYRFPAEAVGRDAAFAIGRAAALASGRGAASRGRRGASAPLPDIHLKLETRVTDIAALAKRHDAVFAAPGVVAADRSVPGCDFRGVVSAVAFLEECRRKRYANRVGRDVVVIGGGNVAVDAAMAVIRCAEEMGGHPPRVRVLYRRTRDLMPAWEREVREAERVGVVFHFLVAPACFTGERGKLTGVEVLRMRLGRIDATGRRAAVPIPGATLAVPCDQAILAMGTAPERSIWRGLPATRQGYPSADRRANRVMDNVYAGGDVLGGEQSIVAAVGDAKRAARAIAASLERKGRGDE